MDERIGVGIIVGIITALGLGLYNYLKNYNSIAETKKSKKLIEKLDKDNENLEKAIRTLGELHHQNLLTEQERDSKINSLKDKFLNERVKDLIEYKTLSQLLTDQILSKNEFDEKIDLLKARFKEKNIRIEINETNIVGQRKFSEGKKIATISYITIIGTIIAATMNSESKNSFAAFHIRQSLGIFATFFAFGYFIGYFNSWMITSSFWVFIFVLWMYGFLGALDGKMRIVPIVGPLYQKLFKGIN